MEHMAPEAELSFSPDMLQAVNVYCLEQFLLEERSGNRKKLKRRKRQMVSHEQIEEFICQYPVYQYAFFHPGILNFPIG